jgi:hypothetical protein
MNTQSKKCNTNLKIWNISFFLYYLQNVYCIRMDKLESRDSRYIYLSIYLSIYLGIRDEFRDNFLFCVKRIDRRSEFVYCVERD